MSELGGFKVTRWWHHRTLLLRRGGQAGPGSVSRRVRANAFASQTYHSYHLVQHRACLWLCRCRHSLPSPAAKTFSFRARYATGTRAGTSWRSSYLTSFEAPSLSILHTRHDKMAASSSVARAARQLAIAAARRPAPFACQRWQLQAQKQRLFSVSATCMCELERAIVVRGGAKG